MAVTSMSKPANNILQRDRFEGGGNGVIQGFSGTRLYLFHPRFELGESEFDGVEVGAVTWKKQQRAAFGFDSLPDPRTFVDIESV